MQFRNVQLMQQLLYTVEDIRRDNQLAFGVFTIAKPIVDVRTIDGEYVC